MSKRHPKDLKRVSLEGDVTIDGNYSKIDHNFVLELIIGSSNVKRWNKFKVTFSCTTNEEFATFLLDLAQKSVKENHTSLTSTPSELSQDDVPEITADDAEIKKHASLPSRVVRKKNRSKCKKIKAKQPSKMEIQDKIKTHKNETQISVSTNSLVRAAEEVISMVELKSNILKSPENKKGKLENLEAIHECSLMKDNITNDNDDENEPIIEKENKVHKSRKKLSKQSNIRRKLEDKQKKRYSMYDIRKAPELNKQIESGSDTNLQNNANRHNLKSEVRTNRVAIKIKLCCACGTRHTQDQCPLQNPCYIIKDSLDYNMWLDEYKPLFEKNKTDLQESQDDDKLVDKDNNFTFAFMSLPSSLYLDESSVTDGLSIFTSCDIKEFTQFGPLIGKIVKEVDIPEDFNMKFIWELYYNKLPSYVNTEDLNESNWIRFMRPAPTRNEKNIISIAKSNQLFLITTKHILAGEELLYWHDDIGNVSKKKMEKTTCGGCNMTFAHPLYYRTHCSIFHDMRYSLTIRKYHCKVCGVPVLGKENIMKHAAELHNGQGAYQCQFCKKFFLRLNYLEMHRTYGCSANPHRSRPLCDFCGRKFCQPQKLKVHIKRMHSDLSEVLKEFQCKSCMKLLGSRAALQRHMKEVHNKQVNGACACSRCGKLFQNKSNLKIHMLTHSGIKPFKCSEGNCNAAFTTKQCLQFHYKKVHGFAEDQMPKIERSVDYTFEAYSGVEDQEHEIDDTQETQEKSSNFVFNDPSEDENSMIEDRKEDSISIDQVPLDSPVALKAEYSPGSDQSPPTLEPYSNNNLKILNKGNKKWLEDEPLSTLKADIYQLDLSHSNKIDNSDITLDVEESQTYERAKLSMNLNAFSRHESSNASLLVEAALDSVTDMHCGERNINIDVDSNPNGTDALVNNLCTLGHPDTLSDVPYNHSVDIGESRDINLISPSVNEPISVTDGENMGIDYSNFHHSDFSPSNSPGLHHRAGFSRDYIDVGQVSPPEVPNYGSTQSKSLSPSSNSPRYNFGHNITRENVSSDDSNGIGAQNLSIHGSKNDSRLDLSIYKSSYSLEAASLQLRKDFGMKLNLEPERKQVYVLDINDAGKIYNNNGNSLNDDNDIPSESAEQEQQVENFDSNICNKDFDNIDSDDGKHKNIELDIQSLRAKYHDTETLSSELRNKQFELDMNLRSKGYDITNDSIRSRTSYESTMEPDFRIKTYDTLDGIEVRGNLTETEFRIDRNFEPLMLNSTELQGLDMSARSYHNYHPSPSVQNLNRYHHLYPDVDRPSVDLRLNYSPPLPSYTHSDVLRVVSLDLTSPGRHSVDLSLRSNPLHVHQLGNSRLLSEHSIQTNRILSDHNRLTLDQTRILSAELTTNRHMGGNSRILDTGNRILSDHSTNRLLSNDQLTTNHLISSEDSRLITEQTRLLPEGRILTSGVGSGAVSPIPYASYSVSPTSYHPTTLTSRSHTSSPTPTPYHHYSSYY